MCTQKNRCNLHFFQGNPVTYATWYINRFSKTMESPYQCEEPYRKQLRPTFECPLYLSLTVDLYLVHKSVFSIDDPSRFLLNSPQTKINKKSIYRSEEIRIFFMIVQKIQFLSKSYVSLLSRLLPL